MSGVNGWRGMNRIGWMSVRCERCESLSSWNLTGNVLRETKKIVTSYLVVDRKNSIGFKKCCIQCTFLDLGGDAGRTRVLSENCVKYLC